MRKKRNHRWHRDEFGFFCIFLKFFKFICIFYFYALSPTGYLRYFYWNKICSILKVLHCKTKLHWCLFSKQGWPSWQQVNSDNSAKLKPDDPTEKCSAPWIRIVPLEYTALYWLLQQIPKYGVPSATLFLHEKKIKKRHFKKQVILKADNSMMLPVLLEQLTNACEMLP